MSFNTIRSSSALRLCLTMLALGLAALTFARRFVQFELHCSSS